MQQKNELIKFCHLVHQAGYVAATDGNLSLRSPDGTIFITASGKRKGDITQEDICHCRPDGELLFSKNKYSTESKLHFHLYRHRPEINAVIHCHPPVATAFASSNKSLDLPILPEIILTLGRIPLCKYAAPSTDALPESLNDAIRYANVFLLQNHGAVAIGKTIQEAYNRMEKLEHYAKVMLNAELLGGARPLSREQLDELYRIAPDVYGIHIDAGNRY